MAGIGLGFVFSLLTAILVIWGDYVIKIAADTGGTLTQRLVVAGCLAYAISALLWFGAMRHISLMQGAVAYSMFSLIALALVGVIAFDEPFGWREVLGIAFALLAMLLMVRTT